jgi:hypothetical protein
MTSATPEKMENGLGFINSPKPAPTNGKICAASGRALQVGERYYAVLHDHNGKFVRTDYSLTAWTEPPANAIAYWTGKVPPADRPNKPIIDDELLMECLNRLAESSDLNQIRFRYVVALLLMRRKRLKYDDAGADFLTLRDSKSGEKKRIVDPRMTEQEITDVQEEVFKVFGWNG